MRSRNSWSERKWYSRASCSPGRRSRVVADTVTSSSRTRFSSSRISVPLPAPDGPVTTTREGRLLPVEEVNQLRALPVGQAADGLGLADAARVQEARRLHAAELRHSHQDVDYLRRRHVLGWVAENRLDPHATVLQILLQLRAPDTYVVRPLQRVHSLVERPQGCVCWRLRGWHGRAPDTTNVPAAIKRRLLRRTPAVFPGRARRSIVRPQGQQRALRDLSLSRRERRTLR